MVASIRKWRKTRAHPVKITPFDIIDAKLDPDTPGGWHPLFLEIHTDEGIRAYADYIEMPSKAALVRYERSIPAGLDIDNPPD